MSKFFKIFFIVWVAIAVLAVGIFIGALIENVNQVKDIEPNIYYESVERIDTDDFSLHMDVIDINRFIDSYKTSLRFFTANEINENGAMVYADLCWYRDIAEQLGVYTIYDNARTIIHAFEDGKPATELEAIIIDASNTLQEELK